MNRVARGSPIVHSLETLYRKMQEAGVQWMELEIAQGEKLSITRASGKNKDSGAASSLTVSRLQESAVELIGTKIHAPLSGVFYRATSPSAAAFVEEGGHIKLGDVLCIIEAMKVMNEIKTTVVGRVLKVLAVNGKHVKKGDVIMIVEAGK